MVGSGFAKLVNQNSSNFMPPSMDSNSFADTRKSFFPMGAATAAEMMLLHHSYPPDLLSRTSSQSLDLRLSEMGKKSERERVLGNLKLGKELLG